MPSAGARSHRPRRRGIRRCEEGARPRPDRYWRSRDRPRAGIARGRDPLREGTDAIRPRHRGVPDDPVEARTSSDRARRRAAPGAPRRGARRRRTSVHRCRLQGQALREPGGNTRRRRVAAGPGRIRIPAGFPRRAAPAVLKALYPRTGQAYVVGITGPPGGGKSTLVNRLAGLYRESGMRVAIVAVDPSSPFTGGAILGDRIRMQERSLDDGIFIRSMASRGHAGGLARATARLVNVLDALGNGVVIVETVVVGQEEVDVVSVADTVCLVTVPGLGDDIQAIKAGVLEIADVLVVNKADRPGADETVRDLAQMLSLAKDPSWKPPIVRTAARSGEGIEQLVDAIAKHRAWAEESGERTRRRREAARSEVLTLLREALLRRLEGRIGDARLDAAVSRVADRRLDPYAAVDELLRD